MPENNSLPGPHGTQDLSHSEHSKETQDSPCSFPGLLHCQSVD